MAIADPHRSFWARRRVFVTGATGFLGGWLVRDLLDRGAEVVALVRDGAPRSMFVRDGLISRVETVHGSLTDVDLLRRAVAEYEVETVFHLAAQAIVGVAKRDPAGTLDANIRGTWQLLEATRGSAVRQVVVASSDKAYGASAQLPYRESHPLEGRYPYDVSKSCADLICRMYAETYGVPVVVTRCGNLFGGGDMNFSRTVPGLIRSTLAGEPFVIRSDGKYVRDFIYVRDAADAYMVLAERLAQQPELAGEAFNFSLEVQPTVLDLVNRILVLMGRQDLAPRIENSATSEIREQYMSAEKARRQLGWRPRWGLEDGLRETIDWYRARATEAPAADTVAV
jgi:CDP-glucose 4,6-dehydratase